MRKIKLLFPLILFLSFFLIGDLKGVNPVFKEDFEGLDKIPEKWTKYLSDPDKVKISIDSSSSHSGRNSLLIENKDFCSSTIFLNKVSLKVGNIYRLKGWIKTEKVYSDSESRYPTSLPACLSMHSFPFTNHSPTVGGTSDWTKVETIFIATKSCDFVKINLGMNGKGIGKAWFDDIVVEEVEDINDFIPMERVKWFGEAYRYDENGWILIHIEGEPYDRGYQHGFLLSREIVSYIEKLAIRANSDNPSNGWNEMRLLADSLFLRKFEREFLEEMKGIADGAVKAGARIFDRPLDLLDIVTINSAVDIGQLSSALFRTSHPLSRIDFGKAEEELKIPEILHKCSSLLATKPASEDGRVVFGQLFMWNGYTGVHWNVICDLVPSKGFRFVYETFPGGIHSGADFYINSAGIMIGETTVMQTPFNIDGTPQSNRIRKAIQYGKSIDDVVSILIDRNNGLYTNDWLIADTKTDEIAILLLGTDKYKLWRSSKNDFPGGTVGFYWSDNNAKDPEVRKEYVPNPLNSPFDLIYKTSNRDIEFYNFYKEYFGKIDSISLSKLWASSPINRPHACDGKITTSEMAEKLVFLAHFGKTTLREKFPEKGSRLIPDLPGAIPHLTLGYTAFSPIYITEKLKEARRKFKKGMEEKENSNDLSEIKEILGFNKKDLWINTVYPSSDSENWFVSGTSAYWNILNEIPDSLDNAYNHLRNQFKEMNQRLLYIISREGDGEAIDGSRIYDGYRKYEIPRIKGTFLLHQLRLYLGNKNFSKAMKRIHNEFAEKEISNSDIIRIFEEESGKKLDGFIRQWLERRGLPSVTPEAEIKRESSLWKLVLRVSQKEPFYHFFTTVSIEQDNKNIVKLIEVKNKKTMEYVFKFPSKPKSLSFNVCNDLPLKMKEFYTFSNITDDFKNIFIVYGTSKHTDTNRTLAMRLQASIADAFTEILIPLKKDSELTGEEISSHDLLIIGSPEDNSFLERFKEKIPVKFGKGFFEWNGKLFSSPDDGLFLAISNPFNKDRVWYIFLANSALELYHMTKRYQILPTWAIFKGEKVLDKGFAEEKDFSIKFRDKSISF
jgi:hypothetical protein